MDRSYIDNHHVVARYLADRLSEEDRRAFENYMHSHPEVVQDLEAAVRLKVGLNTLAERRELDSLVSPTPWFRNSRSLALAATIVVVVIGSFLWIGRGTLGSPPLVASLAELGNGSDKPLVIASTHAILRTRGANFDADIALPIDRQAIELRVLPETDAHPPRYRASLARVADDDSITAIGSVAKLTPGEDGFVTVYMDSGRFTKGRYQLTLSGDADTDAADSVSRFKLRLTDPPTQLP